MQVDNPLFLNGGYDFNVVIIKQKVSSSTPNQTMIDWKPSIVSQIVNVSKIIDSLRQNCLFSSEINFEVWEKCSNFYSGKLFHHLRFYEKKLHICNLFNS